MNSKKWSLVTLSVLFGLLLLFAALTVIVDPYFHYHAPLPSLRYEMTAEKQRYLNDGISRNFAYNAMLTGTSMVENANVSTIDKLFGVKCVKTPYEGAGFKEVDQNIRRAIAKNPDLRLVIRSIDFYVMENDKDDMLYDDSSFPRYLYNSSPFDDVNYLFNKTVFFNNTLKTLERTRAGEAGTSLDEYSASSPESFGREMVLKGYSKEAKTDKKVKLPPEAAEMVAGNILQNFRETAEANPQIQFYYFFSPCSLLHWYVLDSRGYVEYAVEMKKLAASLLADLDNVRLFCFDDLTEIAADLDNYRDLAHYSAAISDKLFAYMAEGKYRLTPEKIDGYFHSLAEFYTDFDYDRYLQP